MRGQKAVDPAGRAAARCQHRLDFGKNFEAVFEPAIGLRLHNPEQIGLPHARDHVFADPAGGLGLLRALARDGGNVAGPAQKLGDGRPLDR